MSQDEKQHEDHLHADQDEAGGTDEQRFGEQAGHGDAGDTGDGPKPGVETKEGTGGGEDDA